MAAKRFAGGQDHLRQPTDPALGGVEGGASRSSSVACGKIRQKKKGENTVENGYTDCFGVVFKNALSDFFWVVVVVVVVVVVEEVICRCRYIYM